MQTGQIGLGGIIQGHSCARGNCSFIWKHYLWEQFPQQEEMVTALNTSFPLEKENVMQMDDSSCAQIPLKCCPANHLMQRGNGHFCLVLQCLWDGVGDCQCVIPLLAMCQHNPLSNISAMILVFKKKKKKDKQPPPPRPLSFYPFVVKLFLGLEIHENENQTQRKGGSEMLLATPMDYWQLAKSHQKGWSRNISLCVTWRIRALAHCIAGAYCAALLATLLLISPPLSAGPLPGN